MIGSSRDRGRAKAERMRSIASEKSKIELVVRDSEKKLAPTPGGTQQNKKIGRSLDCRIAEYWETCTTVPCVARTNWVQSTSTVSQSGQVGPGSTRGGERARRTRRALSRFHTLSRPLRSPPPHLRVPLRETTLRPLPPPPLLALPRRS